jgi:tRNA (cmo5U34)-methyltransferase
MNREKIFRGSASRRSDFEFNAEVAEVFDEMLLRSVPFYLEQQYMIKEIGKKSWQPGTDVYDLGCYTGTTLINFGKD